MLPHRALDPVRRAPDARTPLRGAALSVVVALLAALAVALPGTPADAAITSPFTQVFSVNTNGSIQVRGNTVMTCVDSTACTTARDTQSPTVASGTINNNGHTSRFVDVDAVAGTFNSSTARVDVPAGGNVLFAALVWSARLTGGTPAPNPALAGQVSFTAPGAAPTTVAASRLDDLGGAGNGAYQGYADVTALVQAAGSGAYTVANVQASIGTDRYAGWSLVVALADPSAPARNLTVYRGFGTIENTTGNTTATIDVDGFLTPPAGPVRTELGVVAYEGDAGSFGDGLRLNSTNVSDARNAADNVFNSTLTERGVETPGRTPSYRNQLGFDADVIAVDGALANSATSARITLTTGGETYYPGIITFATELYDPTLLGTKSVTDVDGGQVLPGDVLEYSVPVQNIGLDDAVDSTFFDAVPSGTTYVPGSLRVDGLPLSDAPGDDTGELVADAHQGHLRVRIGAGADAVTGGRVPADGGATTSTVTFRVRADADSAGRRLTNAAAFTYRGLTTGQAQATASNAVVSPVTDVPGTNGAPTATPHVLAFRPTPGARTFVVDALAGDSDPDGDPLTITGLTDGAGGPVTPNPDGTLTYAPADGFAGRDAFTYTISDGRGGTSTAVVRVDVVNDAPAAGDDTATTPAGTAVDVAVLAGDTDANGDALAVRSAGPTSARGGTVTVLPDGTVRYLPPAGWRGTDTFTYLVEDSRGATDTGTVTVTVTNNPPVARADGYTTQVGAAVPVAFSANDSDADGDTLTASVVTGPVHGTLVLAADGTGTYTPAAGWSGTDTVEYQVSDGNGGTTRATATFRVNAAPVAADDTAWTPTGVAVEVEVLTGDSDPEGGTLSVVSATQGASGSTVVTAAGLVRYTPAAGFAGQDTFSYTVSDGDGGTASATVTVTVLNADPVPSDDAAATTEGTAVTGVDVLRNDSDPNIPGTSQVLSVTGATATGGAGVVVEPGGTLAVTPVPGYKGTVVVTYTVVDGAGGQAEGTLRVTVADAAPTAVPDGPVTTPTGTSVLVDVVANDTDPNGDALTLVGVGTPVDAGGAPRGTVVVEAGQVRWTPPTGWAGTVTVPYRVSDGTTTVDGTLTVTVANAAPVAVDDAGTTTHATSVTVDVLANDTDANVPGSAQRLDVVSATAGHGATVVVDGSGRLVVTPAPGFRGRVVVDYTVADGAGGQDTGQLVVTVADAAPVARPDAASTRPGAAVGIAVLDNDTDPNGDTLTIRASGTTAPVDDSGRVRGTVVVVDGRLVYTPPAGFTGVVTFDYTVVANGMESVATATVTVAAPPAVGPAPGDDVDPAPGDDVDPPAGVDRAPGAGVDPAPGDGAHPTDAARAVAGGHRDRGSAREVRETRLARTGGEPTGLLAGSALALLLGASLVLLARRQGVQSGRRG